MSTARYDAMLSRLLRREDSLQRALDSVRWDIEMLIQKEADIRRAKLEKESISKDTWITADGDEMLISDMTDDHVQKCIWHLQNRIAADPHGPNGYRLDRIDRMKAELADRGVALRRNSRLPR
jgi:hypothetical protein